ncbi:MAG: hypothetical protein V2I56_09940 [Desulfobacteraceae bacterium]|jgi:hypothetical protein|nr:hypothetical protein [Desulfobacteraceae bacterium]
MADLAIEKARDILRSHVPLALPQSVQNELERIRQHGEKYLKDVTYTT